MESYSVSFWITNWDGFRVHKEETVVLPGQCKTLHRQAENFIKEKYKFEAPEVVSIKYQ